MNTTTAFVGAAAPSVSTFTSRSALRPSSVDPHFQVKVVPASRPARVTPTASVEVFEHVNYGGQVFNAVGNVPNLVESGFNDVASSLKIPDGEVWILYEHVDYQGKSLVLTAGDYPNIVSAGFPNDILSSIRTYPASILLFRDIDFGGPMITVNDTDTFLSSFNDQASSAIVVDGTWELYEHENYEGTSIKLSVGRYANLNALGNDVLSSLRPV